MSTAIRDFDRPVAGRVDAQGRLVAADPPLAALNASAGGEQGGMLSVPQIAALARLARRLGISISRAAVAADGDRDLDLWVRASPEGDEVALSITGWGSRPASVQAPAFPAEREADFVRATADWTWETDETLTLTALAPGASAAVRRNPRDFIGQQLTSLLRFREGEDGGFPILTALAEHKAFDHQLAETRDERRALYHLSAVPLIDGNGRFAGFRGAAMSAAHAPQRTDARAESESSAFGERLDSALRGPLAHIIDSAERLQAQPEGPLRRDYASYAGDIASAGRHLLALVDDLVDLQAIERADFRPDAEPVDLADIARRAAGLLAVRAGDRGVRIDGPGLAETLPAIGDFTRALQVMMNLLTNAIRYTPEGGQIWLRTEQEGDLATLIVADQGKGIASEDQQRIFERFGRVDPLEPGGTGLGLYIARRLARAMNGDLSVDSAPGQGARFAFTLPLRKDARAS
jgi:signal transduction histidine kinase